MSGAPAKGGSLDTGTRATKTFALRMIEWADPESLHHGGRPADAARAFEQAVAATLRGLARRPVRVGWHAWRSDLAGDGCTLPLLPPGAGGADRRTLRGIADEFALRLRLHDAVMHRSWRPAAPAAADLFDRMERARCLALGIRTWPGTAANLAASNDFVLAAQVPGAAAPPVAVMLDAVLAAEVVGLRLAPALHGAVPRWRAWLGAVAGLDAGRLTAALGDQARYAAVALPLALALADRHEVPPASPPAGPRPGDAAEGLRRPAEGDAAPATALHATGEVPARYAIFTRAHDRIVDARSLGDDFEFDALRRQLDAATEADRRTLARLSARLQRRLLARQRREWQFDLEEGLLDAGRLARIVVDPGSPLSFKQEIAADFPGTAVTLLVDNSGSMRGRPILVATAAADMLAQALERARITVEILGFTTASIRGGRSRLDWIAAGRPPAPGRIGDLLHIVYKDARTPYRRARRAVAAALKPGLLRENVDGEALEWAAGRLRRRPEPRRILLVISDGAPSEEATLAANGPGYLAEHLREVIGRIERAGDINLRAIGIGHDVDRTYRHAVTLPSEANLARFLFDEVDRVLLA